MVISVYKTVKSGDIIVYSGKSEATKLHKAYYKEKLSGSPRKIKDFEVSKYTTPKHNTFSSVEELMTFLVKEEGFQYL